MKIKNPNVEQKTPLVSTWAAHPEHKLFKRDILWRQLHYSVLQVQTKKHESEDTVRLP